VRPYAGFFLPAAVGIVDIVSSVAISGRRKKFGSSAPWLINASPFLGEVHAVVALIDREVKLGVHLRHIAALLADVIVLGFLNDLLITFFGEEFDQCAVLRQAALGAE
jgi:hypothetical protein